MKILKKITAVMAAFLIVVNIATVNIFAVGAAPVVAAGEFAEVLIAMLMAAGHSQSELSGMSVTQMQSVLNDDLNSGRINSGTILIDPITQKQMTVLEYYQEFLQSDTGQVASSLQTSLLRALNDFIDDVLNPSDNSFGGADHGGGGSGGVRGDAVSNYFVSTPIVDRQGSGALAVRQDPVTGQFYYYYCDYISLEDVNQFKVFGFSKYSNSVDGVIGEYDPPRDKLYAYGGVTWKFYGDVRYADGTDAPSDDETEYVVGEADGTKVTVDMLNPDGTVTIDGVTYYPADYLDPDKLTDTGKDALIAALLAALANTYVKSEDKPIVDVDDITVEVAEEFQDYAVPVGIANVFPFCIPWDIVRGFQLLNEPVVIPKFEIPFNIPAFGLFPGVEKSIILDFSEYDTYIQIFRWFQILGFCFLLCKLSMTHVKGAGA